MWFLVASLLLLLLSLFYVKVKLNYWSRMRVPHLAPEFLIGNLRGYQSKYKVSTLVQNIYEQKKGLGPIIGMYVFTAPVAIVSDLDFLKNVFVKDFEYFSDRGLYYNERDDPLSANLVSLPHSKWKPLRTKFSTTFQSSRLKAMHPIFDKVAKELKGHLHSALQSSPHINISETFNQFTTSLILQTVYGIESECLGHPENVFCKVGPSIMRKTKMHLIKDLLLIIAPNLSQKLHLKFNRDELRDFFRKLSRDAIEYRERNQVVRNDFIALLMQIRKSGSLDDEDKTTTAGGGGDDSKLLTEDEVAAQAFIFFFGGFETSSKTLGFVFYELALNQEIQERARQEIQKVYEDHGQTFSYQSLQEMSYLNQIVSETLRKYPVIDTSFRKVQKDYQIPNTSIILREGQKIIIPTFAIHRDKDLYPDPDTFDPDRFSKENISKRHQYAWIPFGGGPRHCIGARYANYQVKIAVATVLNEFLVKPFKKTEKEMKFKLNRQILEPLKDIWLQVESL